MAYASELPINLETTLFRNLNFLNRQLEGGTLRAALDKDRCRWRIFQKQCDLLDCFEKEKHLGLMPFVFHHAVTGRRHFVLVHPLELLHRTQHKEVNYFYEIIADKEPVKLYLDLEYDIEANPNLDGDALTEYVVDLFLEHLNARLGLELDGSVILDLDSSSTIKFSRHVIFNTKFSFKSNLDLGAMVRLVTKNGGMQELRIHKKDKSSSCFVDLGVYTRNRHFRLLGSQKFGGEASLKIRGKDWESCNRLQKEIIFLSTLVTHGGAPVVDLPFIFAPLPAPSLKRSLAALTDNNSGMPAAVDAFFESLLDGVGVSRILRYVRNNCFYHVLYSSKAGGVCGNKGAAHKRHRVMWVLAPRLGTFHQLCGDKVDCPNYVSPRHPLPTPLASIARPPLDSFEKALSISQGDKSIQLLRRKK